MLDNQEKFKIINQVFDARGEDEERFLSRVLKIYNSKETELKEDFAKVFAANPHNAATKFSPKTFAKFWPYYKKALVARHETEYGWVAVALNDPENFEVALAQSARLRKTGCIDPVGVFNVYMTMFGSLCIHRTPLSYPMNMDAAKAKKLQKMMGKSVDFLSDHHVSTVYGLPGFDKQRILDIFLPFAEREWKEKNGVKSAFENNIIDGLKCILTREAETENKTYLPRIIEFMRNKLPREKVEDMLRKFDRENVEDYFEFASASDILKYIKSIGGLVDENGSVNIENAHKIEFMLKRINTLSKAGEFSNQSLNQFASIDYVNVDDYADALVCDNLSEVAAMVKLAASLNRQDIVNKLRARFVNDKATTLDANAMLSVLVADQNYATMWAEKLSTRDLTMNKAYELCCNIILNCPDSADEIIEVIYDNAEKEGNTNAQIVTSLLGEANACYSTYDIERIIAGNENSISFLKSVQRTYFNIANALSRMNLDADLTVCEKSKNALNVCNEASRLLSVRIDAVKAKIAQDNIESQKALDQKIAGLDK